MASRQVQLQSHRYHSERVVHALVRGDADPAQPPSGTGASGAVLAGLLIAAILLGAAAGYGAVTGTARIDWRDSSVVIVERESGARYVYREGALHPVYNYSSALLIVAAPAPRTVLVSRAALRDTRRGAPLGIPGAPDSLPAAADLLSTQWTVCSGVSQSRAGEGSPLATVLVGSSVASGHRIGPEALLVRTPQGDLHLLWQGHRHAIEEPELVLSALGWGHLRPVPVATEVLRAIPAGAGLVRPELTQAGARSAAVAQALVGEVFVVTTQSGSRQHLVAQRTGLAPITQVQADLLLTAYDQAAPTVLTQGRFRDVPRAPGLIPDGPLAPPATTPELRDSRTGTICVQVPEVDGTGVGSAVVWVDAEPPAGWQQVHVPSGRGAVVEAVPVRAAGMSPAGDAPVILITGSGLRHRVADRAMLPALGYPHIVPVRLPADVVELVPAGPDLDRELALS